jgi:C-terminal processing protease CtpA/Prc
MRFRLSCSAALLPILLPILVSTNLRAQQPKPAHPISSIDLQNGHAILRQAYDEVKKNYYDPKYHGIDIDATYHRFDERMNSAQSINETFRVVAAFLAELHDSHTFFQPPMRQNRSTFGYETEMVGDKCFVIRVRPGTDAATKLHVGDQVLALDHFNVARADYENMHYFLEILSPAPIEILDLQSPNGQQREETVQALLRMGKKQLSLTGDDGGGDFWQLVREDEDEDLRARERYAEAGDVLIWKMPTFEVEPMDLNAMFSKARKHQALVIDLRGNRGGAEDTLKAMLAQCFDHDLALATRVSRKDNKPILIKVKAYTPYTGKLIVLVDSKSASAAELFARVIQLEKRGQVIGDRSAGAVMEARDFGESLGFEDKTFYGFSITAGNLLMNDGKSLETTGVTPDEEMLPTAQDIADGKDPVLAHAVQLSGATLDPAAAGKLFPFEWPTL